ncbi:MAG: helix-turn-helix domain-containing protein [Myxococcota bacterium]
MTTFPSDVKGILDPRGASGRFTLARHAPCPELAVFVEHHWIVRWNIPAGETFRQETLPFPSVHLVFQAGASGLQGVMTRRFTTDLVGRGQVVGTKFKPGGWYGFSSSSQDALTDRLLPLEQVFPGDGATRERAVLSDEDDARQVRLVEAWLLGLSPKRDELAELTGVLVQRVRERRDIVRAEQLGEHAGWSLRTLQRMFRRYVGVGPKWVIQRFRLQEAADRLARGTAGDGAALALELGYFDQAHFAKDFKALVGQSPSSYAARCAAKRAE